MKKIALIFFSGVLGLSACIAGSLTSKATPVESIFASASSRVPTGIYWNGSNFVKVESDWVRISINGNSKDYSFEEEVNPYNGSYALKLYEETGTLNRVRRSTGMCITVFNDGTLIYEGVTYKRK